MDDHDLFDGDPPTPISENLFERSEPDGKPVPAFGADTTPLTEPVKKSSLAAEGPCARQAKDPASESGDLCASMGTAPSEGEESPSYNLLDDSTLKDFLTCTVGALAKAVPRRMHEIEDLPWNAVADTVLLERARPGMFPASGAAKRYAWKTLIRRAIKSRHSSVRHSRFQEAAIGRFDNPHSDSRSIHARLYLSQLMKGLSARQRRILIATECYGYEASEVAEMEGLAVRTIYNLKGKAIKAITKRAREREAA